MSITILNEKDRSITHLKSFMFMLGFAALAFIGFKLHVYNTGNPPPIGIYLFAYGIFYGWELLASLIVRNFAKTRKKLLTNLPTAQNIIMNGFDKINFMVTILGIAIINENIARHTDSIVWTMVSFIPMISLICIVKNTNRVEELLTK